jgi:hypothetical protein
LATLPSIDEVKEEADRIRMMIIEKYGSKKHQEEMSYDDKRKLLHWLFDGKDQDGVKHGIFIIATRRGKHQKVDYYLYGRIVGLRTIQGDDYDYNDESEIIRLKSPLEIQKTPER